MKNSKKNDQKIQDTKTKSDEYTDKIKNNLQRIEELNGEISEVKAKFDLLSKEISGYTNLFADFDKNMMERKSLLEKNEGGLEELISEANEINSEMKEAKNGSIEILGYSTNAGLARTFLDEKKKIEKNL